MWNGNSVDAPAVKVGSSEEMKAMLLRAPKEMSTSWFWLCFAALLVKGLPRLDITCFVYIGRGKTSMGRAPDMRTCSHFVWPVPKVAMNSQGMLHALSLGRSTLRR